MMNILISQQVPSNLLPYKEISERYGVNFDFKPFFKIEPLSTAEFRTQRLDISTYTAIVFSSRLGIDAFFELAEQLRVKIPDTMKYFCTTEVVAIYLQKHITYRKRKIFYGDGTSASLVNIIGNKHKEEKFLITTSDNANSETITKLFTTAGLKYDVAVLLKSVSQDLKDIDLKKYSLAVLYNAYDVKSLMENFPDFEQGDLKFIAYGRNIVKAMESAGLQIAMQGPSPEAPSAAKTIELYLKSTR